MYDDDDDDEDDENKEDDEKDDDDGGEEVDPVVIELVGIEQRLHKVPVPAGNYGRLRVTDEAMFWLARAISGVSV